MVHWQIKLVDWKHGHTKWYGRPVREMSKQHPGMWINKVEPYKYSSLEEARRIVSTFPYSMRSAYQIKIFKITPKKSSRKRKR